MSEEQLFKCAAENTRRLFPPVVRSMNDIMKEMFARDGMPQEIAEMMIAEIPPEQTMWVISNEKGINGAASMLYENELHELAESLESDLYILPSSVHEVIAVSSDMGSPEMLAQMVVEVNMQEVSLDERLSNQVYHCLLYTSHLISIWCSFLSECVLSNRKSLNHMSLSCL